MKYFKVILTLFTFIFLTSISSYAQEEDNTKVGVKIGANFSTIAGDATGVKTKTGLVIGLFAQIKGTENLVIQPELVYSSEGAQFDDNSGTQVNYNYINIPVLFKLYANGQGTGLNFNAGPQFGFLANAKIKSGNTSETISDQISKIRFGLAFGMGVDINNIAFDLRYNLGLTNTVSKSDQFYPSNVIQLTAGLAF
ncbi:MULTISPECIES: porin family protein [Flammeovirga]|uniref:PorT family protein n=1 Tax=Flammeovirga agarivorans TaxID=2726742 RepID=A0A7X8SMD8_9BACT|nr:MULTISPECIES: porin family protein [Flammeovirga]NLR92816.1 PorT family protein [Flammeovirga agarivorans]